MGKQSIILLAFSFFIWVWIAVAQEPTISKIECLLHIPLSYDEDASVTIHAADDLNSSSLSSPALAPGADPLPKLVSPGRQQVENVMVALRRAGVYGAIAGAIDDLNLDQLPQDATMFVPNDAALGGSSLPPIMPSLMQYHIATQLLSFRDLLQLPTGARIPTLLAGKSILITRSDPVLYTLDGVAIISANLYMDGSVTIHGINGVLNSTLYGEEIAAQPAPPAKHSNVSAPARQPTDATVPSLNDSIPSTVLGAPVQDAFNPSESSATPLFTYNNAFLTSLIVACAISLIDITVTIRQQLINTV